MERSTFRVLILLMMIASFVAVIVSSSGNHWIKVAGINSGLWQECEDGKCHKIERREFLPVVRAALAVGLALLGISTLYYVGMVARPRLFGSMCMSVFLGLAAFSLCVGLSVYTYYDSENFTNSFNYHWCFFLAWLGFIFSVVATGLACHDARKPSSPYENAIRLA